MKPLPKHCFISRKPLDIYMSTYYVINSYKRSLICSKSELKALNGLKLNTSTHGRPHTSQTLLHILKDNSGFVRIQVYNPQCIYWPINNII